MLPKPSVVPIRGQRALAAIVVTDGVGFSARMSADEELTLGLIHRDLQLMQHICEQHEGQVLKSTGDGLLMYFVSAIQAVQGAIAIQQHIAEQASQLPTEEALSHRIGIHLGDVFLSESDVMGNGVNIAARLQTQAEPGGICISQTVHDVVKSRLSVQAIYLGPLQLKNIREAVPAYHIAPASPSQVTSGNAPESSRLDDGDGATESQSGSIAQPHAPSSPQPQAQHPPDSTPDDPPPPNDCMEPGHVVYNRYCIQRVLGQGGFGRTYLAQDIHRFDDWCVLKEFLPINASTYVVEKSRGLFEREAKTLYQIDHPQIPKFLAWFTHNHRLFIVQEYIDGQTYSHVLGDRRARQQPFTEPDIIQWLTDLLDVLSYLHGKGIVHRDISPDNIMLPTGKSKPMLIDFGLVKQTVSELWQMSSSNASNSQHSFVGKLGYAPPEQIRMGQCFPASDLYALGVTAIVLLTGREPNRLMDQGSLEWNWRSHVQVSDGLAHILDTMLADKPKNRYSSAQDALVALQQLQSSDAPSPLTTPPISSSTPALAQSPSPSPSSPPSGTVTPPLLEIYKEELTKAIGPMASYVVAETQGKHPDASPAQLMHLLAQDIPDPRQAESFKQNLKQAVSQHSLNRKSRRSGAPMESPAVPIRSPMSPSQPSNPGSSHHSQSSSAHDASPPQPSTSARVSPEFIERCGAELAQCIGPMAAMVMDDVLAQGTPATPQQLVRAIAAEIPDPKKARAFEQALL